ncbi:MAG: AraC family transcriptional regulator [Planctomycetales bacterium]|nr:AraC family transcriptional regulator [Planctomycetales bacterium]
MTIYELLGNQRRVVRHPCRQGYRDIRILGVNIQSRAKERLSTHTHKDALEIVYLVRGEQVFDIEGADYRIKGGDIFITWPHEKHGSGTHLMGKSFFYWIQIKIPKKGQCFLNLDQKNTKLLWKQLSDIHKNHFKGSKKVERLFFEMLALYCSQDYPLKKLMMSIKVTELLVEVMHCANKNDEQPRSADITAVIHAIKENPGTYYDIRGLAHIAGLSCSHFSGKFKEQIGISPIEYLTREKIAQARQFLSQTDKSITEIAVDLQFSSSQYFSMVFKKLTMQSPTQYRQQMKSKKSPRP